jgi:hypothetical protein
MPTNYMPAKQVAKLLRAELKEAFPDVKFSVRTRNSLTLDVAWTDGPPQRQVWHMTRKYEGEGFDPMQDLRYPKDNGTVVDGVEYKYLTDFVLCQRTVSPEVEKALRQELAEGIAKENGVPVDVVLWDHGARWNAPQVYMREVEFGPWEGGLYLFVGKLAEVRASVAYGTPMEMRGV